MPEQLKSETKNETTMSIIAGNKGRSLKKLDVEILLHIANGVNQNRRLHERLLRKDGSRTPKPTISRHMKRLVKLKLVAQTVAFNDRIYELTDRGKGLVCKFVAGGEGGLMPKFPIRAHNIRFKSSIVRAPRELQERLHENGWIESHPRNWRSYSNEFNGCDVLFTTRNVVFMPPPVYGSNADECVAEAWKLVSEVKEIVEECYQGLVLGTPGNVSTIIRHHYARPFDPASILFYKERPKRGAMSMYEGDRLSVDRSEGFPELETTDDVHAKDDFDRIMSFYEDYVKSPVGYATVVKRLEEVERLLTSDAKAQLSASFTIQKAGFAQISSSVFIQENEVA